MRKRQKADDSGSVVGNESPIRVLIADDHPLIRAGLGSTLAAEPGVLLVGEATNGDEVQRLCQELQPDVLLLDLRMPGPSALETVACLCQCCPATKVLMLTAYDDEAHVRWLVEAGVAGYLLKDEAPTTVAQAIRAVMRGDTWFSREVAEQLARPVALPALSQRQRELLRLVALGMSNQQIADELCIAEVTVRFHLRNIYKKVSAHTRGEAIRWAIQHGLGEELVLYNR